MNVCSAKQDGSQCVIFRRRILRCLRISCVYAFASESVLTLLLVATYHLLRLNCRMACRIYMTSAIPSYDLLQNRSWCSPMRRANASDRILCKSHALHNPAGPIVISTQPEPVLYTGLVAVTLTHRPRYEPPSAVLKMYVNLIRNYNN